MAYVMTFCPVCFRFIPRDCHMPGRTNGICHCGTPWEILLEESDNGRVEVFTSLPMRPVALAKTPSDEIEPNQPRRDETP
jgi:hypothetical protein